MSDAANDRPVWRSLLYVPVNVDRYVDKAHTRGADGKNDQTAAALIVISILRRGVMISLGGIGSVTAGRGDDD